MKPRRALAAASDGLSTGCADGVKGGLEAFPVFLVFEQSGKGWEVLLDHLFRLTGGSRDASHESFPSSPPGSVKVVDFTLLGRCSRQTLAIQNSKL